MRGAPRRSASAGRATARRPSLVVRCDPALALQFSYETDRVRERLNAYFGYPAVGAVRIVQQPHRGGSRRRAAARPRRRDSRRGGGADRTASRARSAIRSARSAGAFSRDRDVAARFAGAARCLMCRCDAAAVQAPFKAHPTRSHLDYRKGLVTCSSIDRRSFLARLRRRFASLSPRRPSRRGRSTPPTCMRPASSARKSLGPADAPVTVVEYASMSCPHCAHFDTHDVRRFPPEIHRHRQGALHLPRVPAERPRLCGRHGRPLRPGRPLLRRRPHLFPPARTNGSPAPDLKAAILERRSRSASPSKALMPACRIRHCSRDRTT